MYNTKKKFALNKKAMPKIPQIKEQQIGVWLSYVGHGKANINKIWILTAIQKKSQFQ